jgi:hypothetical protein
VRSLYAFLDVLEMHGREVHSPNATYDVDVHGRYASASKIERRNALLCSNAHLRVMFVNSIYQLHLYLFSNQSNLPLHNLKS